MFLALPAGSGSGAWAQSPDAAVVHWTRQYTQGETLRYRMKANNRGWQYQVTARNVVKQDAAGAFYEEIGWSDFGSNASMTLSPESLAFRQKVSLEPSGKYLSVPDLSHVQPALLGPITDLLTFYSDLFLATKHSPMRVGQTVRVPHGTPNSWADGQHVVLGEDSIDFVLTAESVDRAAHTQTLVAQHVPPARPQVRLQAEWMKTPVAEAPNNWVSVTHEGGIYKAEVGQETFTARIVVDSRDGKIISVHMDNPVIAVSRECMDEALTQCGAAAPDTIRRVVDLELMPSTSKETAAVD